MRDAAAVMISTLLVVTITLLLLVAAALLWARDYPSEWGRAKVICEFVGAEPVKVSGEPRCLSPDGGVRPVPGVQR